jgi:hypothetical protein
MQTLDAVRKALTALLGSCTSNGPIRYCPIIEALTEDDEGKKE